MRERDYQFDNLKVILIFLVVLSHFVAPIRLNSHGANFISYTTYFFHMPFFVFICGYFSKKQSTLSSLFAKILFPYIVFQTIYYVFFTYIIQTSTAKFSILTPQFSLWFLLSLFTWRVSSAKLIKMKTSPIVVIIVFILLGVAAGYDDSIGSFGSLSRTIVFFPFFLMGLFFNKTKFEGYIRNKKSTIFVSIVVLLTFLVSMYFKSDIFNHKLLEGSYSYANAGIEVWYAGLFRASHYIFVVPVMASMMILTPNSSNVFTSLGDKTLNVYILHGLIFWAARYFGMYDYIHGKVGLLVLILLSVVLVLMLSSKMIDSIMGNVLKIGTKLARSQLNHPSTIDG